MDRRIGLAAARCIAGIGWRSALRRRRGVAVSIATHGATAVHRAAADETSSAGIHLDVAPCGFIAYLPGPSMLFPGAALLQTADVACARGGSAIVADAFTIQ